jgi:hypothetical protein
MSKTEDKKKEQGYDTWAQLRLCGMGFSKTEPYKKRSRQKIRSRMKEKWRALRDSGRKLDGKW